MSNNITRTNGKQIKQIISELFAYYRIREGKLVQLLYKHGITQQEIADQLGVARTAVTMLWPKGGEQNAETH